MQCILQQNQLFYFFCICLTQTIALTTKQNDELARIDINNNEQSYTLPTSTRFSSTSDEQLKRRSFEFNLKIIGIVLACIIFVFATIRLCLMVCNSSRSSSNRRSSNRRTSVVRPQVAIVELNHFKPDLPPAYAEAVANIDIDESKLPSYDELRRDRQST